MPNNQRDQRSHGNNAEAMMLTAAIFSLIRHFSSHALSTGGPILPSFSFALPLPVF